MDVNSIISYLEDHNNDLLAQVDHDDAKLVEVASLLTTASTLLKIASDLIEEDVDEKIADSALESLIVVANAFDRSDDEVLIKKASVLDELLFSIAADPKIMIQNKVSAMQKLKDLREKFKNSQKEIELKKRQRKLNRIDEAEKVLKQSGVLDEDKKRNPMQSARDSRNCPDHPGVLLYRVGDGVWQCSLDQKVYDWNKGFKLYSGEEVAGGSVANNNYFPEYIIPAWAKETKI
jgi:hypothetical protein